MKRFIIPIAVALTAVILTSGFFLPTLVSQFRDRQTVGQLMVTDGGTVNYETKSELKLIDRLKMITNARQIEVDKGNNMDSGTAYESAITELGKLNNFELFEINTQACQMSSYGVFFYIDSTDPTKSLIVWDLVIQDGDHDIVVDIDDETGKILAIQYYFNDIAYKKGMAEVKPSAEPARVVDTDQIGRALADYYGLTYISAEPQKGDIYARLMIELNDGQDSISIPVSLFGSGFIINN